MVKRKKKKTKDGIPKKKKVEKIQPVLYTGKRFQNRASQDSQSFSLDLLALGRDLKSQKALF